MKNIMKSNYRYIIVKAFMAMAVIAGTTSCDDFSGQRADVKHFSRNLLLHCLGSWKPI